MIALLSVLLASVVGLFGVWLESWAVWMIWQWKLRTIWPMLDPYVTLSALFYLNLAVAMFVDTGVRDEDARLLAPVVLVGLVWLLIQAGW